MAFIGNGTSGMANDFREREGITVPVYTDPRRQTYAALGAKRGGLSILHPMTAVAAVRAASEGHVQTATAGDALQQGGELVIEPDGTVRFLHLAGYAGDHASVADVLAALDGPNA